MADSTIFIQTEDSGRELEQNKSSLTFTLESSLGEVDACNFATVLTIRDCLLILHILLGLLKFICSRKIMNFKGKTSMNDIYYTAVEVGNI